MFSSAFNKIIDIFQLKVVEMSKVINNSLVQQEITLEFRVN